MPFDMLVKSLLPARDIIHHRPKNHTMLHRKPPFRVEDACTPVALNMGCVAEHGRWADATGISEGLLALPCFDGHDPWVWLVICCERTMPAVSCFTIAARQEPFRQCGETSIRSPSRCSCIAWMMIEGDVSSIIQRSLLGALVSSTVDEPGTCFQLALRVYTYCAIRFLTGGSTSFAAGMSVETVSLTTLHLNGKV